MLTVSSIELNPEMQRLANSAGQISQQLAAAVAKDLNRKRETWIKGLLVQHLDCRDTEILNTGNLYLIGQHLNGKVEILNAPNRYGVQIYNNQYWNNELGTDIFLNKIINITKNVQ